jgi:hydroxymethylbilane synthase
MPTHYRIGTRGSLLALTQAGQVKDQLERLGNARFELTIIKTQGDLITDKPLWQLDGKDFFTRELDQALLQGDVDLVIHSYKDLGSERPDGISLKAITERTFGNDILLIRKEIAAQYRYLDEWIIGTSSPRRMTNLKRSLGHHLPHSSERGPLPIRLEMLRGNVNTRIEKCRRGDFHGIVLALAGIERLAQTESSARVLSELLRDFTFMVLPAQSYPWAAAQGALAVEVGPKNQQNPELNELLEKLHHAQTAREVEIEKTRFRQYGGGCHLALGVAVRELGPEHTLIRERGQIDEAYIDEVKLTGLNLPTLPKDSTIFIGLPPARLSNPRLIGDALMPKERIETLKDFKRAGPVQWFVTHPYTIDVLDRYTAPTDLIWAAGDKTHQALTSRGYFVHGNSDSLGEGVLTPLLHSKALKLMADTSMPWYSLTHGEGSSLNGEIFEGYRRALQQVDESFKKRLKEASAYYWMSFSQYLTYSRELELNADAVHFCGLGKTWRKFKEANLPAYGVPSLSLLTQHYEL